MGFMETTLKAPICADVWPAEFKGEGIMMLEGAAHLQIPQGTPSRKHILCQKTFTMATLSQSDCVYPG